jgi:hypothetical protein
MQILVNGFERSFGLDQYESPANMFVFKEEFVTISFSSDLLVSMSVLYDSSFDRILNAVAYLTNCRPEKVDLGWKGTSLASRNFALKSEMTIRVSCKEVGGRVSLDDFESPGEILLDFSYSDRFFDLLKNPNEEIAQSALQLLNAIRSTVCVELDGTFSRKAQVCPPL